jgi:hypothetical protein
MHAETHALRSMVKVEACPCCESSRWQDGTSCAIDAARVAGLGRIRFLGSRQSSVVSRQSSVVSRQSSVASQFSALEPSVSLFGWLLHVATKTL